MEVLLDPATNEPRHGSAPRPSYKRAASWKCSSTQLQTSRVTEVLLDPATNEPRHGSAPRPSYKRAASWMCSLPSYNRAASWKCSSTQLLTSRVMEVLLDPAKNEPRHGSAPRPSYKRAASWKCSSTQLQTSRVMEVLPTQLQTSRVMEVLLDPATIEPRHGGAPRPSYKRAASWKCSSTQLQTSRVMRTWVSCGQCSFRTASAFSRA
ncbi:hypothetical protein DPMN_171366 [Dreissena polymorpha]|uniref:Uncharacterized protein n=1 Tax=Dreissena polymorpha TaxID=45954 RepID=A0A9D4DYT1_DREPO|nr:hypothetical protein DPMN_171366 [Dreissena polymorpha]